MTSSSLGNSCTCIYLISVQSPKATSNSQRMCSCEGMRCQTLPSNKGSQDVHAYHHEVLSWEQMLSKYLRSRDGEGGGRNETWSWKHFNQSKCKKLECSLRLLVGVVFFFNLLKWEWAVTLFWWENLPDSVSDTQVLVPVFNLPAEQYSLEERNFVMGFKYF